MKKGLLYIILSATLMTFIACSNSSGSDNGIGGYRLTRKWPSVIVYDDLVIINLMFLPQVDTFAAHKLIGANYAWDDPLRIKFLSGGDIVKAEKITCYYPTIWSDFDDDLPQFVYLFNLCYKDTLLLHVNENVVEYPLHRKGSESDFEQFFGSITRSQVLASLDNVSESSAWKRIAGKYRPGDLTDDENEPFDVDPYEIRLVVTFKKGDSTFTKVFCDEAVIGN